MVQKDLVNQILLKRHKKIQIFYYMEPNLHYNVNLSEKKPQIQIMKNMVVNMLFRIKKFEKNQK